MHKLGSAPGLGPGLPEPSTFASGPGQFVHGHGTDLINIKCVSIVKLFCRRRWRTTENNATALMYFLFYVL